MIYCWLSCIQNCFQSFKEYLCVKSVIVKSLPLSPKPWCFKIAKCFYYKASLKTIMTIIYVSNHLNYFCLLYQHLNDAFRLQMCCLLARNTKRQAKRGPYTFRLHTLATYGTNGIIGILFTTGRTFLGNTE